MGNFLSKCNETMKGVLDKGSDVIDPALTLLSDGEGVVGNLPLVKWAYLLIDFHQSAAKRKFERNVLAFVDSAKSGFVDKGFNEIKLEKSSDREEFADTLLSILTESVKPEKAKIVGRLTVALAIGNINFDEFNELCLLIHESSIPAINALTHFVEKNPTMIVHTRPGNYPGASADYKYQALLTSMGVLRGYGTRLELTEDGKKLYWYGMQGHYRNIKIVT